MSGMMGGPAPALSGGVDGRTVMVPRHFICPHEETCFYGSEWEDGWSPEAQGGDVSFDGWML